MPARTKRKLSAVQEPVSSDAEDDGSPPMSTTMAQNAVQHSASGEVTVLSDTEDEECDVNPKDVPKDGQDENKPDTSIGVRNIVTINEEDGGTSTAALAAASTADNDIAVEQPLHAEPPPGPNDEDNTDAIAKKDEDKSKPCTPTKKVQGNDLDGEDN